jgi:hypothetical protein
MREEVSQLLPNFLPISCQLFRTRGHGGSVVKVRITFCYLPSAVCCTVRHFNMEYGSSTSRQSPHEVMILRSLASTWLAPLVFLSPAR